MNHTDNLCNIRVYYEEGKWKSTYKTPVTKDILLMLNSSQEAKKFIEDISNFTGISSDKIYLSTTKGGLVNHQNAVSFEQMKNFFKKFKSNDNQKSDNKKKNSSQYIMKNDFESIDITSMIMKHYLNGKIEPAYYLQTGDDFFRFTIKNPLNFARDVPKFKGIGYCKVRVGFRKSKKFYEIQPELKMTHLGISSNYSFKPGTEKKNPIICK